MRPIAENEWGKYSWEEIREVGGAVEFIRCVKHTTPPNDGYHYIEVTTLADAEQKWERAMTNAPEEMASGGRLPDFDESGNRIVAIV